MQQGTVRIDKNMCGLCCAESHRTELHRVESCRMLHTPQAALLKPGKGSTTPALLCCPCRDLCQAWVMYLPDLELPQLVHCSAHERPSSNITSSIAHGQCTKLYVSPLQEPLLHEVALLPNLDCATDAAHQSQMVLLPNPGWTTDAAPLSAQCSWLWPCRNLYTTEVALLPDPEYLQRHSRELEPDLYLQPSMRAIAISWLVEVALEFEMHQETLFLATHLFDRYLSQTRVRRPGQSAGGRPGGLLLGGGLCRGWGRRDGMCRRRACVLRLERSQCGLSKRRSGYLTGQVQLVATRRRPSSAVLCRSSNVQLSLQSKDLHSRPHVAHHKQALSHTGAGMPHPRWTGVSLLGVAGRSDVIHISASACLQGTKRNTLQLLAVCCLLLASKHEEVRSTQPSRRCHVEISLMLLHVHWHQGAQCS